MGRTWLYFLTAGALSILVYDLESNWVVLDAIYLLLGLGSVAAILVGVRLHKPRNTTAWYLMAVGLFSWTVADATYNWYRDVLEVNPFPSVADVFYLAAYPILAAAIGVLIHHRRQGRDIAGIVDSAIVIVSMGLLSWVFLANPILDGDEPWSSRLVSVAYPVGDILLLAMLVRLVTTPGNKTTAFRLLTGAVLLQVAADTMFATALSDYSRALDALWLGSYVLWGASALHPSMTSLSERVQVDAMSFTTRRLVALILAVFVAPAVLVAQAIAHVDLDTWAVLTCLTVLFMLVVIRMAMALHAMKLSFEERVQLRGDLTHQAAHDALTGLADRAAVLDAIGAALHRGQRAGTSTGLLFIDLDHFKQVNDVYGHRAGDDVLIEVSRRMRASVREGDTVGRLGGDEFVILLEALPDEQEVVALASRLLKSLRRPIVTRTQALTMSASIGVAFSLDASTNVTQLLHEADVAAYRAKTGGRDRAEVFDETLRRELDEQTEIEEALGIALATGELVLFYQPIVYVSTGTTVGYEALIRWNRPGHGLLEPDAFIPIAERSDLICDIDRWVLRESMRQLAAWTEADPERFGDLAMGVNISGRHFAEGRIIEDVLLTLEDSRIKPSRLVLEVTETVLVDVPTAVSHMSALREHGVTIAIDDFGTGY
ncbi:MAG: hypothetical protein JWP10_1857, partial [Nocardioidaceae bacterium]|nr:hypothetical protein [Nocardioidaceae bacterium]